MKRSIRKGVFETNSSSMHTIVITKSETSGAAVDYDTERHVSSTRRYDIEREIDDPDYLFSWGYKLIIDPFQKGLYALSSGYKEEEVVKILQKKYPIDRYVPIRDIDELKEPDEEGNYYKVDEYWPRIDHQSEGTLQIFLDENSDITLEDFILKDKYVLMIDNDNWSKVNHFIKIGLLNESHQVYKWGSKEYYSDGIEGWLAGEEE